MFARFVVSRLLAAGAALAAIVTYLPAQDTTTTPAARTPDAAPPPAVRPWYERLSIRGYTQIRYNRLLETNPQLQCEQCDRSWGALNGVSLRRVRVIISGQIHPRVFLYLQPDFASSAGTTQNVGQLRDVYADVGLDARNEFRVRIGQSKVPFSYENLQSSQNRIPLDRADATNSAHVNERDAGVFLYWAPVAIRERFRMLVNDGLKGSGDYGVLAFGVFNGQGLNRAEANNGQHVVARATWPFAIGNQIIEPSIAAYGGKYVVTSDLRSTGVRGASGFSYDDQRALVSLAIAPKPFGLLAEYNAGRGPEFNPATDSIESRRLHGGFVTVNWRFIRGSQQMLPFVRYQVYSGGKKHERDARSYDVHDVEAGVEWQLSPAFELVGAMYWGDRRFEDFQRQNNTQRGRLLRLHAQVNY